jgi:hypothetical protein
LRPGWEYLPFNGGPGFALDVGYTKFQEHECRS